MLIRRYVARKLHKSPFRALRVARLCFLFGNYDLLETHAALSQIEKKQQKKNNKNEYIFQ